VKTYASATASMRVGERHAERCDLLFGDCEPERAMRHVDAGTIEVAEGPGPEEVSPVNVPARLAVVRWEGSNLWQR